MHLGAAREQANSPEAMQRASERARGVREWGKTEMGKNWRKIQNDEVTGIPFILLSIRDQQSFN